ncbi:hypothetical protein NIES2119_22425 [[Phormidium ambiguum] IAM M-71]|uniref:Sortilin N-terminal domain-containing protein n=1 Tax=[Phormidium ambiguum] IAM M-71 TaxID=454136 RepID=A0A1U7IAQ4_9CYAN|nr:hypothetical protein [Phormidium ambiguum]OKH33683.1 hypothetical protein NIES2119_22425 [Phormidium ambiguum IAM M-71]
MAYWQAIAKDLLTCLAIFAVLLFTANIVLNSLPRFGLKKSSFTSQSIRFLIIFIATIISLQQIKAVNHFFHSLAPPNAAIVAQQRVTASTKWKNVSIGGGGYVTGIFLHPLEKNLIYIKTDVGGFYRWNPQNQSWIPLTDHFSLSQSNYYGGEALALDLKNPNIVYIAAGKYLWEKGSIFKSSDRGQTWTKLNIDLPMGGNQKKRWAGERLAVNPFNSDIIFFGSRRDGLWKSVNAGKSWTKVTSFLGTPEKDIGISAILFDSKKSGLVYANAYGDGIYKSTDTGVTWQKLSGSPQSVRRIAISPDGTLYVTSEGEQGVSKYQDNVWQNITPKNVKAVFNAISINPNNPEEILVALGERPGTKIYRSLDGGNNWTEIQRSMNSTVPWWNGIMLRQPWISSLAFDPYTKDRVWLTDWYGIWQTENIKSNPVVWRNYQQGHEELVTFALVSPPKGSVLLSGMADVDGFNHKDGLDRFPQQEFGGNGLSFQDTYGIAYQEKNPLRIVRISGKRWNKTFGGAISNDGGKSWQKLPNFPEKKMPLRVAVSATNPDVFLVTISDEKPLITKDGGKNWSEISTLPKGAKGPWNWAQPLAADPVDGKTFYYYASGKLYRSTDGGANFEIVNESLLRDRWHALKTAPGVKGELWLSLDKDGLFRSTNGGKNFTKIPTVERAYLFALGKPPQGSKIPALYLYGKVSGKSEGIFRSLDRGRTWTAISDRSQPIGNKPNVMEASKQQFGLVFIGTNGRGIYYRNTQSP